jgi:hypothetical protein
MCVCFLQMSKNRRRGARRVLASTPGRGSSAAAVAPQPPMTVEQMFMMETQVVQAIGQTLAAMQQVQQQPPQPQPPMQV